MIRCCRHCGNEYDGNGKLCPSCQANLLSSSRNRMRAAEASSLDVSNMTFMQKSALAGLPVSFLISAFALFFIDPEHRFALAAMFGLIFMLTLATLGSWLVMWMELFVADTVLAIAACLLPIGVYYLVLNNPERTKKPFILHGVCGVLLLIASFSFAHVTGSSYNQVAAQVFGGGVPHQVASQISEYADYSDSY